MSDEATVTVAREDADALQKTTDARFAPSSGDDERGFARAPPRPPGIAHRSGTRAEETDTMSGKKETVLDLGKYIDKGVRVKLSGGREGASREFRAPIPSVPKRGDPPAHPSRRNRRRCR